MFSPSLSYRAEEKDINFDLRLFTSTLADAASPWRRSRKLKAEFHPDQPCLNTLPPWLNTARPCRVPLRLMETFVSGSMPNCWSDRGAGASDSNNTYCQTCERRNALSDNLRRCRCCCCCCVGTFHLQLPAPWETITQRVFPDSTQTLLTTPSVRFLIFSRNTI